MIKQFYRKLHFFLFSLFIISFSGISQVEPADSIRKLIIKEKKNSKRKIELSFELIELHYLSDHYNKMNEVILQTDLLLENNKEVCNSAILELYKSKYLDATDKRNIAIIKAKSLAGNSDYSKCYNTKASALLFLAKLYLRNPDDSCLNYIAAAREIGEEEKDKVIIARSEHLKGAFYLINHQFKKCREVLLPLFDDLYEYQEFAKAGKLLADIGNSYYLESQFDLAIEYCDSASSVLLKGNSFGDLANNYNILANNYQNTGQLQKAVETYFKGLRVADKYEFKNLQSIFRYNIGNCYYILEAKDLAFDNFELSLELSKNSNDTTSMIYALNALGFLAIEDNNIKEAEKYLDDSYSFAMSMKNDYMLTYISISMSGLNIKKKDFLSAQNNIDNAYKHYEVIKSPDDLININITQADLYSELKDYTASINLLYRTLKDAKAINSIENEINVYKYLGKIYEKSGDYKNALRINKLSENIEDSLNFSTILEATVNQEFIYHQEEKDKIRELQEGISDLERQSSVRKANFIAIISVITAVFLILLSTFLYLLSSTRKRKNKALNEKNKLIESQANELKSANETKNKLFSIIGHDLKNPFNIIQGYSSLLLNGEPEIEKRTFFYKSIHKASVRLVEMINKLLEWSMAQSGDISFKPVKFSISKTISSVIDVTQANAEDKNIKLVSDFDKNINQEIYADMDMFDRILQNLVINAIKFTNKNGTIKIGWIKETDSYKFHIIDNGIGMESDYAAKIFDKPVIDVEEGTEGEKGTGLGLSICREFINKHNGRIWAESEPGKGTSIYFNIPFTVN